MRTIHCFLIDDDPEEIDIFNLALAELDFKVSCRSYTNCQEALEGLSKASPAPDCIFLDLYMGATSGKECLGRMANKEIISQIPIIILSGSRNEPGMAQLKQLGANAFIAKANTIEELKGELQRYFTSLFDLDEGLTI